MPNRMTQQIRYHLWLRPPTSKQFHIVMPQKGLIETVPLDWPSLRKLAQRYSDMGYITNITPERISRIRFWGYDPDARTA